MFVDHFYHFLAMGNPLMIFILITLNIWWLVVGGIGFFLSGYLFNRAIINRTKLKIEALEKELLERQAEILSLQEQIIKMNRASKDGGIMDKDEDKKQDWF